MSTKPWKEEFLFLIFDVFPYFINPNQDTIPRCKSERHQSRAPTFLTLSSDPAQVALRGEEGFNATETAVCDGDPGCLTLNQDGFQRMSDPQKQSVRAEVHVQRHVPEDGGLGSGQEKVEGGLSGQPAAPLKKEMPKL